MIDVVSGGHGSLALLYNPQKKGGKKMKLNMDVVREILLAIEECPSHASYSDISSVVYARIQEKFPKAHRDVGHYLGLLIDNGFISGSVNPTYSGNIIVVGQLTLSGHDFLNNIRDDGVWKKTKEQSSKVGGSLSLEMVKEVAKVVVRSTLGLS